MRRTVYKYSKSVACLTATGAKVTGTLNGTTVDRLQAGAGDYTSVLFVVLAGTITDGSHVFSVQDSPDNSTWTANTVDVNGTPPTLTSANSNAVNDFGYVGTARYCRVVLVSSGTTTGGIIGATAVLYGTAAFKR